VNPQQGGGQPGHPPRWPPPVGQPVPAPAPVRAFYWLIGLCGLIAIAALATGIVALSKTSEPSTTPPAVANSMSTTSTRVGDTASADRALCQVIAPLMSESDSLTSVYMNTGTSHSPERIAATPEFVSDTKDWASRIQPVIDAHPGVDPYFARTLQRYVDDRQLYVTDLDAGPSLPYDDTVYADSMAAYNGPLRTCYDLGVRW
jgi:hypothetical protein